MVQAPVEIPEVEEEVVPGDEEELEDSEVTEEAAPDEAGVDNQAEIDAAIEALGEDDPLVKQLREKFAPAQPSVDEERLNWDAEREARELDDQTKAVWAYAGQVADPDAVYNTAYGEALAIAADIKQSVQNAALAVHNGDYDPTQNWLIDDNALAQIMATKIKDAVARAVPAERSRVVSRMRQIYFTSMTKSPAHKYLSPAERQSLTEAKAIPEIDRAILMATALYQGAAIRGGPAIKDALTKAERTAEREREKHRETLLATIGGRGAVTGNGTGAGTSRKAYKDMSPEEQAKLSSEQIDAMTQRFLTRNR